MSKFNLCGLLIAALACMGMSASEAPIQPIGFFVENLVSTPDDGAVAPAESLAKFIRDGQEYEAKEGDEVFPGDVIVTDKTGGITVAFMDSSAVRLFESTELRLDSAVVPVAQLAKQGVGMTFTTGRASVAFQHEDASPRSLTLGVGARAAAKTTGPAKLEVLVTKDASGGFLSNVAVTAGTVTLTPKGSSSVDLVANTFVMYTVNTATSPASPGEVKGGNLTKDQIKALKAGAVSDTLITQGKGNSLSIKTTIKNSDGTTVTGKVTVLNGVQTKDSWKTVDSSKKAVFSWTEGNGKISVKRVYEGFSLAATSAGKASLKGPDKSAYKGTSSIDTHGVITFTTTSPAKDGSTAFYSYDPSGPTESITVVKNGIATRTVTMTDKLHGVIIKTVTAGTLSGSTFTPTGPSTTTTTTVQPFVPPGNTPDGRTVDQNSAPVSQ